MKPMRRVVFYIEDSVYKKLKSILALHGDSLSGWLRKIIEKFVKDHEV